MDLMSTAQLLGNVGEFAGAIGVIATLIYLSIQVRQNTATMQRSDEAHRREIDIATNSRFNEQRRALYSDPDLARIFRTGLLDPSALDELEWMRFYLYLQQTLIGLGEQYRVSDSLLVSRDESIESFFSDLFRYPGGRAAWNAGATYDPEWASKVQEIYDQTSALSKDELANHTFPWFGFAARAAV